MYGKAIKDLGAGVSLYYVWVYQAYHDITAKYKRTFLGSLWLSGGFVVTSVSFAILFGALFQQKLEVSLPYTMAGILVFGMVGYMLTDAAEMFLSSGGIIKNHAYPFTFYAFHTSCKVFFLFLHNLIVFWLLIASIGAFKFPHWSVLLALPVVLVAMVSWGMLMGMLASRFRDMRFMLPYLAQLFSVLTPIFWHAETLKGPVRIVVDYNPFYGFVQIVREPLLGQMAPVNLWISALCYTGLGLVLWLIFFPQFRKRIPFWV
jgi:ABC-type polysaccharide/polyol phosphate export permease